ncbi:hypothetical protein IC582_008999 [Cucumis melo]
MIGVVVVGFDGKVFRIDLPRGSRAMDGGARGASGGVAAASSTPIAGSSCACFDIGNSCFLCFLHFSAA